MSLGNRTEDGDKTLFLQRETSEISSPLNEPPVTTNALVVDPNFVTLLKMKKIMNRFAYQVTVYTDAEEALAFLTNCKHEINIVIWDLHMPGINGCKALQIIGTKMDLPVVIMSDDIQTESVMKATIHGACDYVMKPVRKEVIANIWQHIVRKRMMSKSGLIPPVQLDVVHNDDGLKQDNDDHMPVDQGNREQNINMIGGKTAIGEMLPIQSDSVQSNGLDQDNHESRTGSSFGEENIEREKEKVSKKRMAWTRDLQHKFLKAIDILGGAKKANPKSLLKLLQDMKIEGLTRSNVSSHLQKYRLSLEEKQISQHMQEVGWSSAFRSAPLLGMNNVHTATSSLMNGRTTYPVQENQYQNGYLELNNNQFMTNTTPRFPYYLAHDHHFQQQQQQQQQQQPLEQQQYQLSNQMNYVMKENGPEQASCSIGVADLELTNTMLPVPYDLDHDHHLQQHLEQPQYQLPHQWNNVMRNNEPEQAAGIDVTDLEAIYPSLPYDPNDLLINGYNFNQ